jgi:hypothetical protein
MKTKLDGQVQETHNTAAHALDPTLAADHKAPLPARLPDDVVTDAFLRVGCYMASVSLARNRPSAPFAAARSFRRLLSAAVVVPPSLWWPCAGFLRYFFFFSKTSKSYRPQKGPIRHIQCTKSGGGLTLEVYLRKQAQTQDATRARNVA